MNTARLGLRSIAICAGFFLTSGCQRIDGSKPAAFQGSGDGRKARVCVVCIDGTGSYRYLDKAKHSAGTIVRQLPPGSKVFMRWITEDSYADANSIVTGEIPQLTETPNPFDIRGKQRRAYNLDLSRATRATIIARVQEATSPLAPRTDICGALFAASERFDSNPKLDPLLIMLTDMEDNTHRHFGAYSLQGAKVHILDFQVTSASTETKGEWSKVLTELGASSVRFSHVDDLAQSLN